MNTQIPDSLLFCIALISLMNTKYSSVQPEILHFWIFANSLVELLSCWEADSQYPCWRSILTSFNRYLNQARKQLNTEHTCTRAWGGGLWNDSSHLLESLLLPIYSTGTPEVSASLLYSPLPLRYRELNISCLYLKNYIFEKTKNKIQRRAHVLLLELLQTIKKLVAISQNEKHSDYMFVYRRLKLAMTQKSTAVIRNISTVNEAIYPGPDVSKEFKLFPNNSQIQNQGQN